MADRIDKFHEDCEKLVAVPNNPKIVGEVQRLSKWLQKHQGEAMPEASKARLFGVLQKYHKVATTTTSQPMKDAITATIEDYLKLPEGKLVSSKSKQQALKWLTALGSDEDTKKSQANGGMLVHA